MKNQLFTTLSEKSPLSDTGSIARTETPKKEAIHYSVSRGFVGLLAELNISTAITSYQSGKLYLLGNNPGGGLMINERLFVKAMGLCCQGNSLVLASLFQIHCFENILEPEQRINNIHDACFVPRKTYTTGALDAHDIGLLRNGSVIFVNTRYNCLATASVKHSFTPVWKPPFISKIVDEDRCHLNGMAMENGLPRYVTAVSQSNTIDGWRDRRDGGGVVIDVASNTIICTGLSMPHSPRLFNKKLWILNSGTGELGFVDTDKKAFTPVTFCPGFARGLALYGKYAFVGLSKPRDKRFEGLALDQKLAEADSEAWCGMQVIDIETGTCVEWFRIDGAVSEIYDTAVIPDIYCPMSIGFSSDEIQNLITFDAIDASTLMQRQ